MARGISSTLMGDNIQEGGKMEWCMVSAPWIMTLEPNTLVISMKENAMEEELITLGMGELGKVSGQTISKMGRENIAIKMVK